MKVLVTGADGFVGSLLVKRLQEQGHDVFAAVRPEMATPEELARRESLGDTPTVALELLDPDSVEQAMRVGWDVVVHMAAVSSGAQAQKDPMNAWRINALGAAQLAHGMGHARAGGDDPLLLFVSTAEVYGAGSNEPRVETDLAQPVSPYAASKLAGEVACLEVHRRTDVHFLGSDPGRALSTGPKRLILQ